MDTFEHTPEQMANKLIMFNRDASDNTTELNEETNALIPVFEKLMKSDELNSLAHHLDIMFMSPAFDVA